MAFDFVFQWLQDAILPNNPAGSQFLQPSPCAYADDIAVAASSFRSLVAALSPAFEVVDQIAELNLNHRKCCWVQYGTDSCRELLDWVSTGCEEFREMRIVKYAKYAGTMIGLAGYLHRWTAPGKKIIWRGKKIHESTKSLVERIVDFNLCVVGSRVFGSPYLHLIGRHSKKKLTLYSASLLARTMPFLLTSHVLDPHVALAWTCWGSICSVWPPDTEQQSSRAHSTMALRKFGQRVSTTVLPFLHFLLSGTRYF